MTALRPNRELALKTIIESATGYVDLFNEFKVYDNGWLIWPERLVKIRKNLNLDEYVKLYESESGVNYCLARFLFNKDELKAHKEAESNMSQEQKQNYLDEILLDFISTNENQFLDSIKALNPTPEEELEAVKAFDKFDEAEKKDQIERAQFLVCGILCTIHNYFSVMVNGEKLTSLVPKAIAGDKEAFLKAIKIDRNLLTYHPFFKERFNKAQLEGDQDFIHKITARQSTPNLIGKIRYPGLYFIFSMLDVMGWLNDFSHSQILDICEKAGLDRWQNRIEDVNSVTKQLQRYRRYQKTGGVSMH